MLAIHRINESSLHKSTDESEKQFIWRVGQLYDSDLIFKEDGVTKADWNDLCNLFNSQLRQDDEEWTEAAYRKPYQNAVKYYDEVFKKFESNEYINELDTKQRELQKERYKLQATKLETNRNLRQESRFDLFYENIRGVIESLDPPVFNIRADTNTGEDNIYVLSIGDIHYGANFKSVSNSYSREICKNRFEKLLSELIIYIEQNKISELKIINVADTIQGILRMTDLQINDIPVVDCVVEISRLIAEFLNQLSAVCGVEYYHCSSANHSQTRPLGSKANERAAEDMEKIIVNYISDLLIYNKRVEIIADLSKEYLTFDIFHFKAITLHGHQIKSVKNVIKDLSNLHRTFYDYAFLGHRHSSNETIVGEGEHHNIEVLNCPSFVGSDPYADKLMLGSKAMAKIYKFDSINGHTGSENIILN